MSTKKVGENAPGFSLNGIDGKQYPLHRALVGGPLLAIFFKVSCPTCQFTLPFVERLYKHFRGASVPGPQIWGISQDNTQNSQLFAKEFGITFPVLIDEEPYEISQQYGLTHVPTLFSIAQDGRVEIAGDGFCQRDLIDINNSIAKHLLVKPALLFLPTEHIPVFKPG